MQTKHLVSANSTLILQDWFTRIVHLIPEEGDFLLLEDDYPWMIRRNHFGL